jgi:hypothetical protein
MLDLYAELRRVVEAFDAASVSYALAGGLAVSIYTTPRATQDIDVLVAREALDGAIRALEAIAFRRAGPAMQVAGGRLHIQRLIKIEGTDVLPVDLLVPNDRGLTALLADRTSMPLEGSEIWVVGLTALRALKRLRGSALDRADLEALGPE